MKDELGGGIMKEFDYLPGASYVDKKAMGTKKCVMKRKIKFEDYKKCLGNNETIVRSDQRFRSEAHNVCTEKVKKIVLCANHDKRLQTLAGVMSYPYGTGDRRVCKAELTEYVKIKN